MTLSKLIKLLSICFLLCVPIFTQAQDPGFPEDGENPPGEVPIDGGVGFLIAAGVAYGIKKSKKKIDGNAVK
jgi:hypothetical protein